MLWIVEDTHNSQLSHVHQVAGYSVKHYTMYIYLLGINLGLGAGRCRYSSIRVRLIRVRLELPIITWGTPRDTIRYRQ